MFKTKEELIKEADLDDNNEFTDGYNLGFEEGLGVSFESFAERVEFYKKYRVTTKHAKFNYKISRIYNAKLLEDYPKLVDDWMDLDIDFDEWLLNYCFGDVIE